MQLLSFLHYVKENLPVPVRDFFILENRFFQNMIYDIIKKILTYYDDRSDSAL